jgi:L-alanine-DL-glutamate epimerase-like enolase superfamily enzyme
MPGLARTLTAELESWPIAGAFVIARGAKTEAVCALATIGEAGVLGRGEATPYPRYGETPAGVLAHIQAQAGFIADGGDRAALHGRLPAGAARNAIDCALWDLAAKRSGRRAYELAGLNRLDPVKTAFTLSLASPRAMAEQAAANARRPLLKLKIGGADDLDRVAAVRAAAPLCRLIVDANEGLSFEDLRRLAPEFAGLGVKLIEQPLKAGEDEALAGYDSPVLLCADESLHTRADLPRCIGRYGAVNIKLDKAGGLTEALALKAEAQAAGLQVMVGCMVATSLAMAPAMILAQGAPVVDLDGPLLLARDRAPGLTYIGSMIEPPKSDLWG